MVKSPPVRMRGSHEAPIGSSGWIQVVSAVALAIALAGAPAPALAQEAPSRGVEETVPPAENGIGSGAGTPQAPDAPDASSGEASRSDAPSGDSTAGSEPIPVPVEPSDLAPSDEGVEEIVIQGQRTQGIETDATVSVTEFDSAELTALGVQDVADVAQFTPNLEIRTAGSTTPTFFIRGVGLNDFTANASGAVAIYQDDVALNLPALQLGQIFDVEGVEVLRGPQGSGPGRNASAGAIRIYSRKPTGEFAANLRVDYGNFDFVDAEGALEIPLLDEVLATRLAFRLSRRDGLVENRCSDKTDGPGLVVCDESGITTVPSGLAERLNDVDNWAARGQLRFQPPDTDMEWLLNLHGGKVDQQQTVGSVIGTRSGFGSTTLSGYNQPEIGQEALEINAALGVPGCRPRGSPECQALRAQARSILATNLAEERPLDRRPFEGDYNLPGFERQDTYGGFLRGEWDVRAISLRSVTGYDRYVRDRLIDADYSSDTLFEFDIQDDAWQITQDIVAEGELTESPVGWNVGGFVLVEALDYSQVTLSEPSSGIQPVLQDYRQESVGFGVFAGFTWEFLDDFSLEGGVRYNWEQKTIEADVVRSGLNVCEQGLICVDRVTSSAPTGTLTLTYFFSDEQSAYWKYARGWKGPQLNVGDGAGGDVVTLAEPETIDSLEFGLSGEWFDGRLGLKGALFWYSYQNYQVFTFTNDFESAPQRVVQNADDAVLYGAELEAQAEPIERLMLAVRFGWLEGKFLDFVDAGAENFATGGFPPRITIDLPIEYTGNRLPNTPRFKLSGNAEYTIELGRYGSLIPRYDFAWTDDVFFDPSEGRGAPPGPNRQPLPDFAVGQAAYWIHNARLAYRSPDGALELAGWVRNFTDEVYKTLAFDASKSAALVGNLVGDPRTYGVSLSISF